MIHAVHVVVLTVKVTKLQMGKYIVPTVIKNIRHLALGKIIINYTPKAIGIVFGV